MALKIIDLETGKELKMEAETTTFRGIEREGLFEVSWLETATIHPLGKTQRPTTPSLNSLEGSSVNSIIRQ